MDRTLDSRATYVAVTEDPIRPEELVGLVRDTRAGAVVTFAGTVREWTGGRRTCYLEYEAYREMAEAKLREIAHQIQAAWGPLKVAIVHRTGHLDLGETSVFIAVAAPHRGPAFDACRYAIETLKKTVPIWKKEVWDDGTAWVHPGGREPGGDTDPSR